MQLGQGDDEFQRRVASTVATVQRFFGSIPGQVVLWVGMVWLIVTGRAGFIFDSILYIILFATIVPVVGLFIFRWWLSKNVVEGTCSNCGSPVSGIKGQPGQCLNCGNMFDTDDLAETGGVSGFADASKAVVDVESSSVDD